MWSWTARDFSVSSSECVVFIVYFWRCHVSLTLSISAGERAITLAPHEQSTYELIYSPLIVGFNKGGLTFLNDEIGEFWYNFIIIIIARDRGAVFSVQFSCANRWRISAGIPFSWRPLKANQLSLKTWKRKLARRAVSNSCSKIRLAWTLNYWFTCQIPSTSNSSLQMSARVVPATTVAYRKKHINTLLI